MPKFLLSKLVRDKLKQEYAEKGQKAVYRRLGDERYLKELINKLLEEAHELASAPEEKRLSELADVMQVLRDIMAFYKVEPSEVESVRTTKLEKVGGFSDRTFVESLKLKDDDEWVEYYRRDPEKFPELPE